MPLFKHSTAHTVWLYAAERTVAFSAVGETPEGNSAQVHSVNSNYEKFIMLKRVVKKLSAYAACILFCAPLMVKPSKLRVFRVKKIPPNRKLDPITSFFLTLIYLSLVFF